MRLPTLGQFNTEMLAISRQFEEIRNCQMQISTGKKIQSSSEDPLLAKQIKAINDYMHIINGYELNGTLAQTRNELVNTTVQGSLNALGRIQELLQSAQNDTLNNNDRKNLAVELKGIHEMLLRSANAQDNNGQYIFSGMSVNVPPFAKNGNNYIYQGAQEATKIALGFESTVLYNDSGYQIFNGTKTGNGVFTLSTDAVNNQGTVIASAGNLQSQASFVSDDYTLTFVTNAAGKMAYQVSGQTSGQIIPTPPLLMPDDAPEYVEGVELVFNGVSMQLTGQPVVGDVVNVTPSKPENVFDTLESLFELLSTPINTTVEKANLHQQLGEHVTSFNGVVSHFRQYLTEIGNRGKTIDDQINLNKNTITEQRILLGKVSEVDLGEVVAQLTQRLTTLEVTQQAYLKIQETFNHLINR
ncbi:MAG: flagellar hook-associated protein FlgL [Legionella sp.]|nr:flagellar hook-associated protein FlgL [Legionella sp.]